MKRKRKYLSGSFRKKIWERYNKKCAICDKETCLFKPLYWFSEIKEGHVDHIIPFSKGGECVESNFRWLCARCNLSRGNKDV